MATPVTGGTGFVGSNNVKALVRRIRSTPSIYGRDL